MVVQHTHSIQYTPSMNLYRIVLFVLALLGLLVSSYLLYWYIQGGPITCSGGHGCDAVRASVYAGFFGIPTPAYGVAFYMLLCLGALLMSPMPSPWLQYSLLLLTGTGLAVSAYLTYLEAFVINAWCWWCVVSAVSATLAFLLVWMYVGTHLPGNTAADTVDTI